jgi:hypothetical protein
MNMSIQRATTHVQWSIYALSFVQTCSAISSYMQFNLLEKLNTGFITAEQFDVLVITNDNREQTIGLVFLVVFITTACLSGRWIYLSSNHNHQSGAEGLRYSPGWSIGWYFIPIFLFWKPYQAMKQIYQVSVDKDNWKEIGIPGVFPIWWTLWIISNVIGQVMFRTSNIANDIDSLQLHSLTYVVTLPLELALNYYFLQVIFKISHNINPMSLEETAN